MTVTSALLACISLLAVLGAILLAGRLARFGGLAGRPSGCGRLAVVQAIALDPRRQLHLVRCDGRHLLLLTGGTQDVVVGWLETNGATVRP